VNYNKEVVFCQKPGVYLHQDKIPGCPGFFYRDSKVVNYFTGAGLNAQIKEM